MGLQQKRYSAEMKAKVTLGAIRRQKTTNEVAEIDRFGKMVDFSSFQLVDL